MPTDTCLHWTKKRKIKERTEMRQQETKQINRKKENKKTSWQKCKKWPEIKVRCNFLKIENFSIFGKSWILWTQKLLEDVGFYQMTAKDHESRGGNVKGEHKSREQLRSGYTNTASDIYLPRGLTKTPLQLPITVRNHPQTYCAAVFTPVAVFLAAFVNKTRQANGWFCFKLAKSRGNCKQYWIPIRRSNWTLQRINWFPQGVLRTELTTLTTITSQVKHQERQQIKQDGRITPSKRLQIQWLLPQWTTQWTYNEFEVFNAEECTEFYPMNKSDGEQKSLS